MDKKYSQILQVGEELYMKKDCRIKHTATAEQGMHER